MSVVLPFENGFKDNQRLSGVIGVPKEVQSMSDWQPGQPVATPEDVEAWQMWRKARKLEAQRARRAGLVRIDYYPSPEAWASIRAALGWNEPVSVVIDRLIVEASGIK